MAPAFARIEALLTDRADIKRVAQEIGILSTKLNLVAYEKGNSDEAALLLARQRIKETSQKLRKGQ